MSKDTLGNYRAVQLFITSLVFLYSGYSFAQSTSTQPSEGAETKPAEIDTSGDTEEEKLFLEEESDLTFSESNGLGTEDSPSSIRSLLRAVGSLIIVLLLILGVLYAIKRLGKKKASSSIISVLTMQTIQNNRNLLIVNVADSMYLMASSEAGIQLISEITDEEAKKFIKTNTQIDPGKPFSELLARYFPGQRKTTAMHTQLHELRKQSERLKQHD